MFLWLRITLISTTATHYVRSLLHLYLCAGDLNPFLMSVQGLADRANKFFDHRLQFSEALGFFFSRDKRFEEEFFEV